MGRPDSVFEPAGRALTGLNSAEIKPRGQRGGKRWLKIKRRIIANRRAHGGAGTRPFITSSAGEDRQRPGPGRARQGPAWPRPGWSREGFRAVAGATQKPQRCYGLGRLGHTRRRGALPMRPPAPPPGHSASSHLGRAAAHGLPTARGGGRRGASGSLAKPRYALGRPRRPRPGPTQGISTWSRHEPSAALGVLRSTPGLA